MIYTIKPDMMFFASYVSHLAGHLLRRSGGIIDDGYLCSDDLDGQMAAPPEKSRSEKEIGFLEYVVICLMRI